MDAIEYLNRRKLDLEGAKVQAQLHLNAIMGGLAEIELAISLLTPTEENYDLRELVQAEEN